MKNWNKILNNIIAGIAIVIVALMIGVGFINPKSSTLALTRADIDNYNIYFVSALTNSRSATGMSRVQQTGMNTDSVLYDYYTYQYNYTDFGDTELFYGSTQSVEVDDEYGNVDITTNTTDTSSKEVIFTGLDDELANKIHDGFIPYNVNYFTNAQGNKSEIFYNHIDDGDYVLIDNYTNHYYDTEKNPSQDTFNVENFYLSFGTPYLDDSTTTPLYDLRVEARLYSEGQTHFLSLNEPQRTQLETKQYVEYWNQYFDLRNLQAYQKNEPNSPKYEVENQQGKYEFTFYFVRYDENLNPVTDTSEEEKIETFTYTFYLLDSADYSNYPTLYEADIKAETIGTGSATEYYYSFSSDSPYIEYDPTKYNLSYSRANNKSVNNVSENIASSFKSGSYTIGSTGINYDKGIITYYKNSRILKQVFILTYHNEDNTLVEHLYLSRKNVTSNESFNPTTYEVFLDNLESQNLQFEYKITKTLTQSGTTYTVDTYKTTKYVDLGFIIDDYSSINKVSDDVYEVKDITNKKVLTKLGTKESSKTVKNNSNSISVNSNAIATFGTYPKRSFTVEQLTNEVLINTNTLLDDTTGTLNNNNSKYKLIAEGEENTTKNFSILKTFKVGDTDTEEEIELSVSDAPLDEIITLKDPINSYITIRYKVVETQSEEDNTVTYRTISDIEFLILSKVSVTGFTSHSNMTEMFDIIDYENYQLNLDFTYEYCLEELGIYDITYSYVSNAANNLYYTNSQNVSTSLLTQSGSTNYTAPVNFSAIKTTTSPVTGTLAQYDLSLAVSGIIQDTNITLNGETFVYTAKTGELTNSDASAIYELGKTYTYNISNDYGQSTQLNRIFEVKTVNQQNILSITYLIGSATKQSITTDTKYSINGKYGYRTVSEIITTINYSLKSEITTSTFPTTGEWNSVINAIAKIANNPTVEVYSKNIEEAIQGKDKLHIFGSIAYFNKEDDTTDSNYAKLKQVDSKLDVNYVSDVTSLYVKNNGNTDNYLESTNAIASNFAGEVASLLTKDQIIITDVTPVLWNNFSTLYYTNNNKRSMSYIFRYTDYEIEAGTNKIIPIASSRITSTYTKDIHCQFDGLYEIVVFYQYDNLPTNASNNIYYQLFTFIIDNSSPDVIIETENNVEIEETETLPSPTTLSLTIGGETLTSANGSFGYYSDSKQIVAWLQTKYNKTITSVTSSNFATNIDGTITDTKGNEISASQFTVTITEEQYGPAINLVIKDNAEYENIIIYYSDSLSYATDEHKYFYTELDANAYTNKNVRISWLVPTYFQNDIYIEIDKQYYNTTNSDAQSYNFNTLYKQMNTIVNKGIENYIKGISEMNIYTRLNNEGVSKNYYYVDLKVENTTSGYTLNGNYNIIMHYSTNGKSTFTEPFIIDKLNIDGLTLESVLKNADGTYQVDPSIDFGSSQIVNSDFTFRFNRKESLADIFVYYDEIELTASTDYDKIINDASGNFGITTKYLVKGKDNDISIGTPYSYEYTHEFSQNYIASKNILTSNSSRLYLFRLEDEAGNQARYVVFYDATEPRFLTVPKPDSETHIVNDTTRVIWGDYKAIKIDTDTGFEITNTDNVTNYSKEEDTKLGLVLRYINSSNNKTAFNNLKVEKIGDDYYILVPVTSVKIQDSEYGNKFELDLTKETSSTKDYFFFPTLPFVLNGYDDNDQPIYDRSKVTLPVYNADGSVVYEGDSIKKAEYKVVSYSTQNIKNYNNENVERHITLTYYTDASETTTKTITGAIGEGKFTYTLSDKLSNRTSGLIWMNLDKTQTMAYGIFDYTDKLSNATAFTGSTGSYATSKMFISSLVATETNKIPNYEVTYKHYAYDTSIYNDYVVNNVELETNSSGTFLKIAMTKGTTEKTVEIQLTDEDGNEYPRYSYPYSLEGKAIVSDTKGNPVDIYSEGYQYKGNDTSRKYSLALNPTTDTIKEKIVTEEGLYIFKRTYTDKDIDKATLGTDKRIIYRIYYVDRNGIINISSSSSVASSLYNIGNDINFTLGHNYNDVNYQKNINATDIQNNQTAVATSKTSNANYISSNLFDTNKIQVEFEMTYDKHNFANSVGGFETKVNSIVQRNTSLSTETKTQITTYLNNTIFNKYRYFEDMYHIDLTLKVGQSLVIDESDDFYSTTGSKEFLKSSPYYTSTIKDEERNIRNDYFHFYLDTSPNQYDININDQSGYEVFDVDGNLADGNSNPNNLKITFDISHTAPQGSIYGKYYGRHNYDENLSNTDNPLNIPSIPYEDGSYAILKYLEEGQLDLLSDGNKSSNASMSGNYVKLFSTNNETMIFTFAITNDPYKAQIDPNNIKIYKGAIGTENLIFNRVNGSNQSTTLLSKDRQSKSFIMNEIDGVTYYAIILFDNNLDEIVDKGTEDDYLQYRLLDKNKSTTNPGNPDEENYYIEINYVGNANDYIGQDSNANKISFYKTTYEIAVDRIKPMYNLTKLMSLDKYVYNTNKTNKISTSNYESIFESYKSAYNFYVDNAQEFERSDLENYFFSLDTRLNTSFVFESIDEMDSNNSFYIRKISDKNKYKFSITPDDYKAYYNATYLQGHPQFTPSVATTITTNSLLNGFSMKDNQYYRVQFALDEDTDNGVSAYYLKQQKVLEENCYYEIIEEDEAGNYRVYAVYVPQESTNKIVYTYQTNSSASSLQRVSILFGNTPYVQSSGMQLKFMNIQTKDNFLKTNINIVANTINHNIEVILDPNALTVTAINRTLKTVIWEGSITEKDKDGFANTDKYIEAINYVLDYYYELINDKTHEYYSEYGYNVYIEVIDRLGVVMKDTVQLYNYEIDYVVAGSILTPIFKDYSSNFTMLLEGQKGSTYLTDITVYKFNKIWTQINSDNSQNPQIFDKSDEELKKRIEYVFNRGVYKFVFTDNFNRTNEFFYEYGISSSQTGGSLSYLGKTTTLQDGYTYSAEDITYTYDSSVYNVYIKFVGKIPNEFALGEYEQVTDSQNLVIFNSGTTYTDEYLRRYGLTVITSGNTTTITFSGVRDATTESGITSLAQYQIKTILASTSTNYTWGEETTNKDIFVYTKKIALYTAIQNVTIKNTSGNTLDTKEHLNLTEDFNLVLAWPGSVSTTERLPFNSKIILTRTYNDNGTIRSTTTQVHSGALITLAGDYTAYVINDLGMMSQPISFTRGEGEISMYAVYGVNSSMSTESKLNPSSMIGTEDLETETKVLFTYFVTSEYFGYKDNATGELITLENLQNYIGSETLSSDFVANVNSNQYIDVRVNSNLSIKTEVYEVGFLDFERDGDDFKYPYVKYQIYSDTKLGDYYIYRFIQVVFVDKDNHTLADTTVYNSGSSVNLSENNHLITSTSQSIYIEFNFADSHGFFVPYGDTMYLDRYYNGEFVETIPFEISASLLAQTKLTMTLEQVGLHEFVLRDLAGRKHLFNDVSNKLQVYLINEILYTVNGENPINNQVFNEDVNISIVFKLGELTLYNDRTLNITITKNGQATNMPNNNGEFTLSEAGYYTVIMSATTQLLDGTSTQVTSTFNFVIVDIEIANRSFSISKGTNFSIEKLIKSVNGQETDITDTYSTTDTNVLLWLSHEEQGNSIFKVTLKYYEDITERYRTFTFNIWINKQSPVIISSIDPGTSTKDVITINFNPGLIYTQIGKGYITLNDEKITDINSDSISFVDTITIEENGTHWLKIYAEDGTLVGSYKFIKNEPMNSMTKIIIIGVVIGLVVVVILFFLLRRKGRYR